jgi:hypothetical protein
VLDTKEEVRKLYGVSEYPTTFFVQPDGKIGAKKVGEMQESYMEQTIASLKSK